MELILLERVEKLGQMGDVVKVKNGYGRNYLLPQGKAIRASKANLAEFESRKSELEARNLESLKEAKAVGEKLDGIEVVLIRQASESGRLYGSVNASDIAEALNNEGTKIERNQIVMERPTKAIGIYDYKVRLHPELTVTIHINVAQSDEEAQAQSERRARGEQVVVTFAERDAQEQADQAKQQADALAEAALLNQQEAEAAEAEQAAESE